MSDHYQNFSISVANGELHNWGAKPLQKVMKHGTDPGVYNVVVFVSLDRIISILSY